MAGMWFAVVPLSGIFDPMWRAAGAGEFWPPISPTDTIRANNSSVPTLKGSQGRKGIFD